MADDLWDDEEPGAAKQELSREWEARHQQFFNTGYREGLDEGKEVYLQQGFNTGFAEGARAGFEYGLARGALQALSAHLHDPPEAVAGVDALRAELATTTARQAMSRACLEILGTRPLALDPGGDAELAGALRRLALGTAASSGGHGGDDCGAAAGAASGGGAGTPPTPVPSGAGPTAAAEPEAGSDLGGSWHVFLRRVRRDLRDLGCDVGGAPPLPAAPSKSKGKDDESGL